MMTIIKRYGDPTAKVWNPPGTGALFIIIMVEKKKKIRKKNVIILS
jgi:hypothetical protein